MKHIEMIPANKNISMKFKESIFILVMLIFLTAVNSGCLQTGIVDGSANLISISDTTLNDSSIFVGHAHWTGDSLNLYQIKFEVWIENSTLSTLTDSNGYYLIKTVPGTYTINCQDIYNDRPELTESLENIKIRSNEKIQIDFEIGYMYQ